MSLHECDYSSCSPVAVSRDNEVVPTKEEMDKGRPLVRGGRRSVSLVIRGENCAHVY